MAKNKGYVRRTESSDSAAAASVVREAVAPKQYDLLFGKRNYVFMLAGLGLIFLGLFLMSGGHMPSREVWDESLIYSPVRITLAPIIILAGLGCNVYAIFAKK